MINDQKKTLVGLGLDDFFKQKIRTTLKKNKLKVRTIFIGSLDKSEPFEYAPTAFVLQAPLHLGQALKLVQEILYQYPKTPLIVMSPKSDVHFVVHLFRAGVYDVIFTPFDGYELAQALRRVMLRPLELESPGDWTPLQAASHFFTRPITDQWDDLAENIKRYFSLFLTDQEMKIFLIEDSITPFLRKKYNLKPKQIQLFKKFLSDPKGLVFGLTRDESQRSWVIKLSSDFVIYGRGFFKEHTLEDEVFGRGFLNLLRGQREHYEAHLERERMKLLALTDEITGLWNMRKLSQDLEYRIANKMPFSLLFIDIDFFKSVNDQFGHVHGSQLLIDMATILRKELRGSDLIYRYGGDEFVVLLPNLALEQSKQAALRLSDAIKENEFRVQEKPYRLSLSVGIAVYPLDATTSRDLIEFADQMMYMSKKSGRGKVFHVTEVI
jgi:diguanylate cyclase (GGDEF)-like protein